MSDHDTSFKIPAASAYAGLSPDTIRDRIRKGQLKAFRSGPYKNSHILIRRADLDAMLRPVATIAAAPTPTDGPLATLAALGERLTRVESLLTSREV